VTARTDATAGMSLVAGHRPKMPAAPWPTGYFFNKKKNVIHFALNLLCLKIIASFTHWLKRNIAFHHLWVKVGPILKHVKTKF
jgi:hypothetical protein